MALTRSARNKLGHDCMELIHKLPKQGGDYDSARKSKVRGSTESMFNIIRKNNVEKFIYKRTNRYDEDWELEPLMKIRHDCESVEQDIKDKMIREDKRQKAMAYNFQQQYQNHLKKLQNSGIEEEHNTSDDSEGSLA